MVANMVVGVYSDDLEKSKQFYSELLDLVTTFDSDWVVQMTSKENENLNLTIQLRDHELIPERFRKAPQGFSIAFVVPDVDAIFGRATDMGLEIVQQPTNEDYGQRRFLTLDPNGLLIDISAACEPSPEFMQKYMR